MLSRVAERLYWLGRYVERVEGLARLVSVHSELQFDLPRGTPIGWTVLVDILGCRAEFDARSKGSDERSVMRFLLPATDHPFSLLSALASARENARTARDVLPSEVWEELNGLYHWLGERRQQMVARRARADALARAVASCQRVAGVVEDCMARDAGYRFLRAGQQLERADMTSRVVDVGAALPLLEVEAGGAEQVIADIVWMAVLRSLGAYQAYRQHVRARVQRRDVVAYLLQDGAFPRAMSCSLQALGAMLRALPRHERAVAALARSRRLHKAAVREMPDETLHAFIDRLQLDLGSIHQAVVETWLLPQPLAAGR